MGNIKILLATAKPGAELSSDGWLSSGNITVLVWDVNGSNLPLWESEGCTPNRAKAQELML